MIEPYSDAPVWYKEAVIKRFHDAVPVKGDWGKAIIFLSPAPKYVGDAPPIIDPSKLVRYVEKYGEEIDKESYDVSTTNYIYPLPSRFGEAIKNYLPGRAPTVFAMEFEKYPEELQTVYDVLGMKIVFKRELKDRSYRLIGYFPQCGRTYRMCASLILDELNEKLLDDEVHLLEKISDKRRIKWVDVPWVDWDEEEVLFAMYYGKVKEIMHYPVPLIQV